LLGVSGAAANDSAAALATLDTAAADTMTISGVNEATVQFSIGDSSSEMAAKINAEFNTTGVKADAKTTAIISSFAGGEVDAANGTADNISFTLSNGTSSEIISFTSSGDANDDMQTMIAKINEKASVTGIGASYASAAHDTNGQGIVLTSEAGDDIIISDLTDDDASAAGTAVSFAVTGADYDGTQDASNDSTLTSGGADSAAVRGSIQLDSTLSFSSQSSSTETGLGTETRSSEISIDTLDLTSAQGSQDAIAVIDGALAKIDKNRSVLGATQNRLESTVNNLSSIVENSSAARSRFRDTDFTVETAELTKNQILQQAGTSILAQANQLPQAALSLLG
jgi:flagellin